MFLEYYANMFVTVQTTDQINKNKKTQMPTKANRLQKLCHPQNEIL